jgi:hypothetical protein
MDAPLALLIWLLHLDLTAGFTLFTGWFTSNLVTVINIDIWAWGVSPIVHGGARLGYY